MTDYHTVNEDADFSRQGNQHENNAGIENKSSEPDENEIMRRKAVDYADDIVAIAKYKARHEGFTNVEQH